MEVELPGVASEGRLTLSLPTRRPRGVLHVRVPGKYAADIPLPAKIDLGRALVVLEEAEYHVHPASVASTCT